MHIAELLAVLAGSISALRLPRALNTRRELAQFRRTTAEHQASTAALARAATALDIRVPLSARRNGTARTAVR